MTLQSSGNIALSEIQTEFGGTNPIAINEYYGAAANIPASGAIKFSDFYGTSALFNGLVKAFSVETTDFSPAIAGVHFNGTTHNFSGYDSCNVSTYQFQTGNTPLLDIMFTKTSGVASLSGVTNNTWVPLNVDQHVYLSTTASRTVTANVQIKYNANSTVLSSNICSWKTLVEI